jgi:4-alpha-glucanotransferase
VQWLLDREHQALRRRLATLNLALYGDMQIGVSPQDAWSSQHLFLDRYRMGAPPSRTNPLGQPWGYPVFHPALYGTLECPGPVVTFVRGRMDRLVREYDGVRVDHPHGWVDPWVYRTDDPDPFHAVRTGARLFSSPHEPDHPMLHEFTIARTDQIDKHRARHADDRVVSLDEVQAARYALLLDTIIDRVGINDPSAVMCEVLSTLPYPVRRALDRRHLGRFRVVQKAALDDPADVYRIENAASADWIMLGTHDTPPIWSLAEGWCRDGTGLRWADYLAPMLVPAERRTAFVAEVSRDSGGLVHAAFAAILASRARHVLVFFADLFGMTQRYNEPGVVNDNNWSLRVPSDFETSYAERCRDGNALDVHRCLTMALRAHEMSVG